MQNIVSLHAVVSGKVQGIGFRWFVETTAKAYGLNGWVKNLPSRDVEIEVEGGKELLESFLAAVKSGHTRAVISKIDTQWHDVSKNAYSDFKIVY